jgi:uncharacterized sulfatase
VRTGNWKLQVNEKQGKTWLFNLATDPTEKVIASKNPAKRDELKAILAAHHHGRYPRFM